ncbi:MAG: hypothetical protein LBR56_02150 [Sporomusaceae bacterium]|nr:hypothetical protein [Sporomusaceae bacterium]
MDREKIRRLQQELRQFRRSGQKIYTFPLDCEVEERIKFIYAVIFPGFAKYKFYWRFLVARIAQKIDFSCLKVFLYRSIGIKIGRGVFISPEVFIDPHFPELIEIGDHCILGWGASLFAHESSSTSYRLGRIALGRGSVIGAYAVIRGGVCIGEMAEVLAGVITRKDVYRSKKTGER